MITRKNFIEYIERQYRMKSSPKISNLFELDILGIFILIPKNNTYDTISIYYNVAYFLHKEFRNYCLSYICQDKKNKVIKDDFDILMIQFKEK
jgi:hypothetical protein